MTERLQVLLEEDEFAEKLQAVARAAQCRHPSPDIELMLEEIERGYNAELPQ